MPKKITLEETLIVRVARRTKQRFTTKIQNVGSPSTVLREFIEAYVDNRLTIYPPKDKESLYVTRNED